MTNPTSNFGWQMPTSTDLVTDLPADFETFGQAVDTSLADLKGGATGQVLAKASATDMDFSWVTTDDTNAIQNAIVDAKGDLISATANDTPARLAVGANGETLVADSSTSTGLRYNPQNALANPVINGGFDIWQRGTSFTGALPNYLADRWQTFANADKTYSRQTTSDTTNLPNIQYCLRLQRNSGSAFISSPNIYYSFENVNSTPFIGKTVTISFYARKGANFSAPSDLLNVTLASGTGTDQNFATVGFTGQTNVVNQNVTLTSTWQRFTGTGTISSTATQLGISFAYTVTGTAGANDYAEVTGVQIDLGTYTASTAPTFRRSGGTIQGELAAAQRYYYRNANTTNGYGRLSAGIGLSTTLATLATTLPVTMRVQPTSIDFSTLRLNDSATATTVTALVINSDFSQANACGLTATVASGLTQYRPYFIEQNNSTTGYIGFSAEL
jgi:hypothetical protein